MFTEREAQAVAYRCFLSASPVALPNLPTPQLHVRTIELGSAAEEPMLCYFKKVSQVLLVRSPGRILPRPSSSPKLADPAVASETLNA